MHARRSVLLGTSFTYCAAWMSVFLFVGGGTSFAIQVSGLYGGMWLDSAHSEHGTMVIPFTGVMMCALWPILGLCTRAMQKGVCRLGVFLSWEAACAASWFGFMACTWLVGILLVNKTTAAGLFFLGFFFNYWWRRPKKKPAAP